MQFGNDKLIGMSEIPCRGSSCKHLQCFDLSSFVFVNEKFKHQSQYICPICSKACSSAKLYIDPIMACILSTVESKIDVIYLYSNGNVNINRIATNHLNACKKEVFVDLCLDEAEEIVTHSAINHQWHIASFSALAEE